MGEESRGRSHRGETEQSGKADIQGTRVPSQRGQPAQSPKEHWRKGEQVSGAAAETVRGDVMGDEDQIGQSSRVFTRTLALIRVEWDGEKSRRSAPHKGVPATN